MKEFEELNERIDALEEKVDEILSLLQEIKIRTSITLNATNEEERSIALFKHEHEMPPTWTDDEIYKVTGIDGKRVIE